MNIALKVYCLYFLISFKFYLQHLAFVKEIGIKNKEHNPGYRVNIQKSILFLYTINK